MNRRTFPQGILATGLWICLNAHAAAAWASRPALEAINTPNPCQVNEPRHGYVLKRPYVWYYRTELRNHLKVPVRILSFAAYSWVKNQWVLMPNVLKRPLGTKEFVAWYSDGTKPHDGWIAPGKTAVCDPNWCWNKMGSAQRYKWIYVAEDTQGKRYHAEAQVTLLAAKTTKKP